MPPPADTRLLVFTDLDGTLLDHDTYSWAAAAPALDSLRERGVPVIPATSKTLVEVLTLRRELQLDSPFIVENGAAAALPDGLFPGTDELPLRDGLRIQVFGADRERILAVLRELRQDPRYDFAGFADWTAEELAARAGLALEDAARALQRTASEPLAWQADEQALEAFARDIEAHGLRLVRGGRFVHVMGRFDKGNAVRWLIERYRQLEPEADLIAVALGDSPNDAGMLDAADIAVVIRSRNSERLAPGAPRVIRTEQPGPRGWRQAIERILAEQPALERRH